MKGQKQAKAVDSAQKSLGPGEYTQTGCGIVANVDEVPAAEVIPANRNYKYRTCPKCGKSCYRDKTCRRTLHDLGDLASERPHEIALTFSQHYCSHCHSYFSVDTSDLAPPGAHYTRRVVELAVRLVVEDGLAYRSASWHLWRDHRVFVPFATIQNWVEAGGKKSAPVRRDRLPGLGAGGVFRLPGRRRGL